MASRNSLYFTVGADIAPGSKAFDELARKAQRSMGDVDSALDDTKSAGQRVADALNAQMDEVDAAMRDSAEAAVALGRALGPELVAKIDLTEAVTKLQKIGLTADDIKADADTLGDALKRSVTEFDTGGAIDELRQLQDEAKTARDDLEQMGKADVTPVTGGLEQVRSKLDDDIPRSAGSANSALANMIGNSSQDFGELFGVVGSLGVGVGQIGEYAADAALDGERLGSALGSMAKVAGPIAALAAATKLVSDVMSSRGKAAEVESANIDRLTEAYTKGVDPARDYADALRDVQEIQVGLDRNAKTSEQGGIVGWIGSLSESLGPLGGGLQIVADKFGLWGEAVGDIAPKLAQAGVSVDVWSAAVMGGNQAYGDMATALSHTTLSAEDQAAVLAGLADQQRQNTEAKRNAAAMEAVFGTAEDEATAAGERQRGLFGVLIPTTQEMADAKQAVADKAALQADNEDHLRQTMEGVNAKIQEQADRLAGLRDQFITAADANIAADEAQQRFIDSVYESTAAQNDNEASTTDKANAVKNERDALIEAAKRQQEANAKTAEAQGINQTATQKVDGFNQSLLNNANFATPAARQAVADYILEANGIPASKGTDIRAAIMAGDFNLAATLLSQLSATRDAAIRAEATNVSATEQQLNQLARDRTTTIRTNAVIGSSVGSNKVAAGGGDVAAGEPVWVGDKYGIDSPSAELFVPNTAGHIYNQDQLRSIRRHASGTPLGAEFGGGPTVVFAPQVTVQTIATNTYELERVVMNALVSGVKTSGGGALLRALGL